MPTEIELCKQAQLEGAFDHVARNPFKLRWSGPAALSYVHGWREGHETCRCVVLNMQHKRVYVNTGEKV